MTKIKVIRFNSNIFNFNSRNKFFTILCRYRSFVYSIFLSYQPPTPRNKDRILLFILYIQIGTYIISVKEIGKKIKFKFSMSWLVWCIWATLIIQILYHCQLIRTNIIPKDRITKLQYFHYPGVTYVNTCCQHVECIQTFMMVVIPTTRVGIYLHDLINFVLQSLKFRVFFFYFFYLFRDINFTFMCYSCIMAWYTIWWYTIWFPYLGSTYLLI